MVTLQQFADGLRGYMQNGVLPHLPAEKQFIAGVALGVATSRTDRIAQALKENQIVKMLGLVDGDLLDDEALIVAMREQMNRQGSCAWDVPLLGRLTFTAQDVDALQRAIHGR